MLLGERRKRERRARKVSARDTLLTSGAGHFGNASLDKLRTLQKQNNIVRINKNRPQNVKFCCAASEAPGEVAEDRGLSVFETGRDLRKAHIAFCEMRVALLDLPPRSDLMTVSYAVFGKDHWHGHE